MVDSCHVRVILIRFLEVSEAVVSQDDDYRHAVTDYSNCRNEYAFFELKVYWPLSITNVRLACTTSPSRLDVTSMFRSTTPLRSFTGSLGT